MALHCLDRAVCQAHCKVSKTRHRILSQTLNKAAKLPEKVGPLLSADNLPKMYLINIVRQAVFHDHLRPAQSCHCWRAGFGKASIVVLLHKARSARQSKPPASAKHVLHLIGNRKFRINRLAAELLLATNRKSVSEGVPAGQRQKSRGAFAGSCRRLRRGGV